MSGELASQRQFVEVGSTQQTSDLEEFVNRFLMVGDYSSEFCFILDQSGRFAYLNPRLREQLGEKADDLIGESADNIGDSEGRGVLRDSAVATGPQRIGLRSAGGSDLWIEITTTPIVSRGSMIGWLGIGRDVTVQRRAEQRLLRAKRELSAVQVVVAEATQAIDLAATLDATLEQVLELLDLAVGMIFLIRGRAGSIEVVAQRGIPRAALADLCAARTRVGEGFVGGVVASGEARFLNEEPESAWPWLQQQRLRAFACAPLRSEGQILGALCVGRREDIAFTTDEVRMLARICSQVGIAIENARLHEEVKKRARRLAILYDAGRKMAESAKRTPILSTTVHAAAQLLSVPTAAVLLFELTASSLRVATAAGIPAARWRGVSIRVDGQETWQQLRNGHHVIVDDSRADGNAEEIAAICPECRSLLAVPLRVQGQVIGGLVVFSRLAATFSQEDVSPLSLLADHCASAMEHARLFEQAEAHVERLAVLNEITKAVVVTLEPQTLLRALAIQVKRLLKYDQLSVALVDDASQSLRIFTFSNDGKPLVRTGSETKPEYTAFGWVVTNDQALVRGDLEREQSFPWDGLSVSLGLRSDITVPLFSRGRIFGALQLASRSLDQYGPRDLELLGQVANQVSVAVDNARLYHQTIADLREINALREVVEFFSADLELDSLLQKIVAAAAQFVGASSGSIALIDEGDGVARLHALHNVPGNQLGREVRPGSLLSEVLRTRQPALNQRYNRLVGVAQDQDQPSQLAVPIWWQSKLIGTFAVGARDPQSRFTSRDSELLELLAKHVAIAIENARLYKRSREAAITEERNRLARDLHDTLAQSLTGIVLQLETVAELFQRSPNEAWEELQEARALARRSLDEARQSVWGLHPTPLEAMTLNQAIEREVSALSRQAGLSTHFSIKGELRPLPAEIETAVFRIAQEALSNVRKHAQAKNVRATILFDERAVTLTVEDDGPGMKSHTADSLLTSGFGLTSMHERARLLGGELRLESAPRQGTRLTATIPYEHISASTRATTTIRSSLPATSEKDAIKVLVADDHPVARQGIRRMLEHYGDITIVAEAADGAEAVALAQQHRPDVILMDLQMPRLNGVEAIYQLRDGNVEAKVLIMSTYGKDEFLFDGIKAGARGYLLKDVPPEELAQAVRAVARGESLLQGVVAGKLLDRLGQLARGETVDELTEREMDVLRLLSSGARNKEIARQLSIAEKTVKFHVANIFRKLGVGSRTEAMAIALDRGLLQR